MLLSRASSLVASCFAFALVCFVGTVLAADRTTVAVGSDPKVVLVTRSGDSEVATLLRAELNALGFEVVTVAPAGDEPAPAELRALARQRSAVAAFRVSVTPDRVEVWVADRVTGKVTLREVIRREQGEPFSARIAVLRAVELLRWSLQELKAPYPARGEIAEPPEPVQDLAASPATGRRISVGASAYGQLLPGVDSVGLGVALAAGLRFGAWGGRVMLGQPLLASEFTSPAGRVEADITWGAAELTWDALPLESRWQVGLGVGARLLSTELTGVVQAPLVGTRHQYYSLAPSLHSVFALRLVPGAHVYLDLSASYLTSETRISLAGESVATLGTGVATLGAGFALSTD